MRIVSLFVVLLMLAACGAPKQFRKLNSEEKSAVKHYRQLIPAKDNHYYVLMMTTQGNMVVKLYDETPLHRDNFMSKVQAGFYDSLLFHRVINNFMIQGGDPTSKRATAETPVGSGSAPGQERIPAELKTDIGIYHKRGALAAARDNNPEKASSNCQFYIVQRPAWRQSQLDSTIVQRKLTLNADQQKLYTTVGGTPHLDGNYTVFGELVIGFDVLDKIATTKTRPGDRPEADVRMRMFVLRNRKSRLEE